MGRVRTPRSRDEADLQCEISGVAAGGRRPAEQIESDLSGVAVEADRLRGRLVRLAKARHGESPVVLAVVSASDLDEVSRAARPRGNGRRVMATCLAHRFAGLLQLDGHGDG